MSRYLGHFAWMGVFIAVLVGCGGGGGPTTYPVTGKITIKGQPAKDILITFSPVDPKGEPAIGLVSADGTYTLKSGIHAKPGALPGKYKVVIAADTSKLDMSKAYTGASGPPKPPESPAPKEYESAKTSPKEVEVQAQNNTIDISI
jgi:hypothetical protein